MADDKQGQTASKVPSNQALTAAPSPVSACQNESPKVPVGDGSSTQNVRCSDKLDDKLSNKPYAELAQVVSVWPTLPEHIRAAIMALVKTA